MDEISYGPDALEEAKKAKPEEKWPWPLRR